MKKAARTTTVLRLMLLLALAAIGLTAVLRGWFHPTPKLSPGDRQRDIEYLAEWATHYSPFVDLNERIKEAPSYEALKASYVELARNTRDNTEFAQIAYFYASVIGASGHFYVSSGSGRKWLRGSRPEYWSTVFYQNSLVHPPFRLVRDGSNYVTRTDYEPDGTRIPSGSQILTVNGMFCQGYLDHVRSNTWIRHAPGSTESLDRRLLLVREDAPFEGWRIEFRCPDEVVRSCDVPALKGPSPFTTDFLDLSTNNCVCLALNQTTGYIRIKSFTRKHVLPDRSTIHLFLARAEPGFSRLIIDLRHNGGGHTSYFYENLMKRFLDQPVAYTQLAGVRRKFIEDHRQSYIERKRLDVSIGAEETRVVEVPPPQGFDGRDWVFYEITRELEPENQYPFEGDIFVLIDGKTGSAADCFANDVKRTGMATLVGQDSHGSAAAYLGPIPVKLPQSGMEFTFEADLVINPDGTYNEIAGTPPDIELAPVDLPEAITTEALLDDEWIQRVIRLP